MRPNPDKPTVAHTDLLLRATAICKTFGGNAVLKNLSVQLGEGDIVLLRGENASGKTTLLNILTGNLEPDSGAIEVKGKNGWVQFSFPQPWWNRINPFNHFTAESMANEGVGRTWQDIRLFLKLSVIDNIAAATPNQFGENPLWALLRPSEVRRRERENLQAARELLDDLRLADRHDQLSDTLSLGQAKRAAIARAVQAGAKVLFLDEPLAGLDEQGVDSVLEMLVALARKDRITLVIVEHLFHIPRLLKVADVVWTLHHGEVLSESVNAAERAPSTKPFGTNWPWISDETLDYNIIERELSGDAKLKIFRRSGDNPCILSVENLIVRRQRQAIILGCNNNGQSSGLSFKLFDGDIAVLEAPNGWGKTTLFEAIMGLIPIAQGHIVFGGQLMNNLPTWRRAQSGISYLQARGHTFSRLTVSETFQLAGAGPVPGHLSLFARTNTAQLSGGQQQLVGLSRVLASTRTKCRLLDEPFNMLDRSSIERSKQVLQPLEGSCCLMAVPASSSSTTVLEVRSSAQTRTRESQEEISRTPKPCGEVRAF
jgi:ABC-type branched-subunit amino acid transport system ATPase component